MRKVLSVLLVLALMFAFVACNPTPQPSPQPEPEPEPPAKEKEIIYIPGYKFVSTSKGMTDFPAGNPFTSDEWNVGEGHTLYPTDDINKELARFYLASNAMSNLPLIPPMQEYEDYPDSVAESFENENLIVFGFPARVRVSKATDDGIYLFIEALEGEKVIAIVEYYYSWETETFSYREIVAAFLNNFHLDILDVDYPLSNTIILFEMNNVPVEESDEKITFSAGVKNGVLDKDTIIRQYRIELPAPKGQNPFPFRLTEFHSLMNHTGNLVTSAGYEHYSSADMFNPETESVVFKKLLDNFLSNEDNRYRYGFLYNPTDHQLELSDAKCNIEFCYDVLAYFFKGFDAFKTKESFNSRVDSIEDMEDFNRQGFEYLDGDVKTEFRPNSVKKDLNFPVMFNLEEKEGTTSDFLDSGLFENWNTVEKLKGFESLFNFTLLTKEKFAVDILMKCGLTEQNAEALLPTPTT